MSIQNRAGGGGVPTGGKSNQGEKMILYHNMPHVNLALYLFSSSSDTYLKVTAMCYQMLR